VAQLGHRFISAAAFALLTLMAALMFASLWDDTLTFDEVAHIGAGYADLREASYRLNPEHPPLFKDLAAAPLLFLDLQVPWGNKLRRAEPFDEWDFGSDLAFHSGMDADTIARVARTPMVLFTMAFGGVMFWWTRRHYGDSVALLSLFFYALSPTFLAHGRLVTNDVAAAAVSFVGVVADLRFQASRSATSGTGSRWKS
jgi:hypothetical protein